jgi:hypothetical protein
MQRAIMGLPGYDGCAIVRGMKHILLPLPVIALVAACEVQGTGLPPLGVPEPDAAADTCGATRFAYLVGQPMAVVDRTTFPSGTRIILPDTAVTMDFREERLNVLIDGNAVVERVYCG